MNKINQPKNKQTHQLTKFTNQLINEQMNQPIEQWTNKPTSQWTN